MEPQMEITTENALVRAAEIIARKAHTGQTRSMGDDKGKPYIIHPMRVASHFSEATLKAAALLHDVLEDSPLTPANLLAEGIPIEVVQIVMLLSRSPDQPYLDYIKQVLTNEDARAIKREDLLDNLQSLDKGSLKDKYELSVFIIDNI